MTGGFYHAVLMTGHGKNNCRPVFRHSMTASTTLACLVSTAALACLQQASFAVRALDFCYDAARVADDFAMCISTHSQTVAHLTLESEDQIVFGICP